MDPSVRPPPPVPDDRVAGTAPGPTPGLAARLPVGAAPTGPADLGEPEVSAQSLARHLSIGVYRSTPEGRILFANPALAAVLGCASVEDLLRIDVRSDLGYPRDTFAAHVRRFGGVRNLVVRWTDRSGRTLYTRENARAVLDAEGRTRYYEGTMEDVTAEQEALARERRRAEQLDAVVRFAVAADAAPGEAELYAAAVEAVEAVMGTSWALLLLRAGGETSCVAASATVSEETIRLAAGTGAFAALPLHTHALLLRDEQAATDVPLPASIRAVMRGHRLRALGSFPLLHHGEAQGAFVVGHPEAHTFSDEERHLAEALAWHIAGAVARARAEASLRASEACLRLIAEHTAHVLYRRRFDGMFDYLSPAVTHLTGHSEDELAALGGLGTLVRSREVKQGEGLLDRPAGHDAPGAHYLADYAMEMRSGEVRWVENSAYPWHDAEGRPLGVVGVLQDVTERKRREDEAAAETQRALARHAALAELATLDCLDALTGRAAVLAARAAGVDRAGVWVGEDPWMVCRATHAPEAPAADLPPAYPIAAFEAVLADLRGQRTFAVTDAREDGRVARFGLEAVAEGLQARALLIAPVRRAGEAIGMVALHRVGPHAWTDAEQAFAAAVADAVALGAERDERARAEAALRASEARHRALSELTSDYAFAIHETDGRGPEIAWATDAFERISGYAPEEIGDLAGFAPLVHPGSRAAVDAAIAALPDAGHADFEACIQTKNGAWRWVCHRARRGEPLADGTAVWYHSGQDVTERKRFEADLIEAREQAEEMARLKSAFLANMSHEIRTPLTSILGYADVLADEVADEQREFVRLIEASGLRLLDTLNSVLDLARLEAEGIRPQLAPVDVAAEAAQAVRLLQPLATRKGLTLRLDPPAAAPLALLDVACFGRILTNLVGNAVKFTEAGGVEVAVRAEAGRVAVEVRDTGIGIDEAFLPHLFDEFRQETSGQARSHEGSGLGLAITRRLVGLMDGEIAVASRRPGGSVFTVAFALHEAAAGAPPSAPSGDGASSGLSPVIVSAHEAAPRRTAGPLLAGDAPVRPGRHLAGPLAFPDLPEAAPPPAERYAAGPYASELPPLEGLPSSELAWHPLGCDAPGGPEAAPGAPAPLAPPTAPPAHDSPPRPSGALPPMYDADFEPTAQPPAFAPPAFAPPAFAAPAQAPADAAGRDDALRPPVVFAALAPPAAPAPPVGLTPEAPAFFVPFSGRPGSEAAGGEAAGDGAPLTPREDAGPAAQSSAGLPAVLVVEDNGDTRMLLDRILRSGYRVTAVGDARSALAQMHERRFDALVLDINLGGKETGADVLRIARALPGYGDVYAIALTAYALPGDRERLLEAGFDEYISKPFTRQDLLATLAAGVSR